MRLRALGLAAALCAAGFVTQPASALTGFSTVTVRYGDAPAQTMTVHVPKSGSGHPAVLYVHGGCWQRGQLDRSEREIAEEIAQRTGWVVAAMNYRTAQPKYKTMPADVEAALTTLQTGYDVDRKRVAIWGESAGAHLGLLSGLKGDGGPGLGRPAALVSVSGPTNMVTQFATPAAACVRSFEGGAPTPALRDRYRDTSPTTWVDPSDSPTLLVTSAGDRVVPATQAGQLVSRLQSHGVAHRLLTVPGTGHGADLEHARTPGGATVLMAAVGFLQTHL